MFSQQELDYLRSQRLARLATVADDGQPTVDAVGFAFDAEAGRFLIGGHALTRSRKHRNVAAGNTRVALIVDDLAAVDPWTPRGIRVFAVAEPVTRDGMFGHGHYLELTPTLSWSWGIEDRDDFQGGRFSPKRIDWSGQGATTSR